MWKERWTTLVDKIQIVGSEDDERKLLDSLARLGPSRVLAFVNAHAMNYCAEDSKFFDAIASGDVLLRDGSGMALLYKHAGRNAGRNMNGTDFIPKIIATFRGRKLALWGTEEPFLAQAVLRCEQEFGARVISREDGFQDFEHYLALARDTQPELIVLAMGMPKQEQLARALREQGGAPLIVCGGAILDFLGGKVSRAPALLRSAGMEWLYRLAKEPGRLFKRYVLGNPAFLLKVLTWTRQKSQ
jgi:N-acetylglucosaminyldiphosphoundecaprenol N-acetyl-beta-D-mannosaminyltransferase